MRNCKVFANCSALVLCQLTDLWCVRFLEQKKHIRRTTCGEVPVPDCVGGSHQYSGRLRGLEHLPPSEQHAGVQPPDPLCLCKSCSKYAQSCQMLQVANVHLQFKNNHVTFRVVEKTPPVNTKFLNSVCFSSLSR